MLVRLLVSIASAEHAHGSGSTMDMPDDEAQRYIDAGMAVSIEGDKPVVETTTAKHKHKEKAVTK